MIETEYEVHWNIQEFGEVSVNESPAMTSDEIVSLASNLKNKDDVIYTYHPEYRRLGARIALWGSGKNTVSIDVQFSSHYFLGDIEIKQLSSFFNNYIEHIKDPESYGLLRKE